MEFKDKEGKVILKKVQLTSNGDDGSGSGYSEWLCTYYVYDYLGRLRAVFQPKAVELLTTNWTPTSDILNELTFRYEYDQRGRMITKQVPGAAPVRMVYDAVDRLILTQDGNMAAQGKWMYTMYDNLNRPVSTGLWPSSLTWAQHAANAANSTTYPTLSGEEELTKTFYDDYSWLSSNGSPFSDTRSTTDDGQLNTPGSSYPYYQALSQTKFTKGIVTGTKTKVLGTSTYLYGISYYDDKGRLIQAQVQNITTGTDITTTQYNWAGQPMLNILRHQKNGANPQTHIVLSRMTYDDLGRLSKTEKKVNSITGSSNITKDWATIALQDYNALGQLKSKKLGNKPGVSNTPLANLDYEYNIRGWLISINKAYVTGGTSGDQYFGMQLGYDKDGYGAFATKQFNGNISGTIWRSVGDGMDRKYEFGYDAANRLLKAAFTQLNGSTWDVSTGIDFSMQMGNGSDPTSAYDANGNIKAMQQKGLKINSSPIIDSMTYSYLNGGNSNKLVAVTEGAGIGSMDNKLGDFTDKNTGNDDYSYDVNGNMIMDKNKAIYDASGTVLAPGISYNHLNLPKTIFVDTKGSIEYVYDATGSKLKKIVHENNKPDKTTLYVAGFVYESDVLQFFGQEEGRIRYQPVNGSIPADLFKDYFIKDHLGNIRMVLTEQTKEDMYPVATMEVANASVEESFYANLPNTRYDASSVTHYPPNSPSGNAKVARVGAAQGREKIGPAIILKVMSGDKFNVSANSWYKTNNGQTPNTPSGLTTTLLNALINGVSTLPGGKITAQELNTAGAFSSGVANFLNGQSGSGNTNRPWAFLNWVLFDEQFNLVSTSSGFEQVFAESEYNNANYPNNNTKLHVRNNMPIDKNGYLYIYVSNETDNIDVFFDNLTVTHIRGVLSEETHYYPFGLTMAGISSMAAGGFENKYKYNSHKIQNKEFSDNSGLEIYDYGARLQDPQLGRFWQVDPKCELFSQYTAYNYCFNNPMLFIDPDGMLAKYNWEDGKYYDGDEEVSWDKVREQYEIGDYAKTTSVMLTPEFESDGITVKNDYNTNALTTILNQALATGGNIRVLQVKNSDDAAEQMEKIDQKITNLFILSHGDAKDKPNHRAYFAIGLQIVHIEDIAKSTALSRIAARLTGGLPGPVPSVAQVVVFACGAGGPYNGGVEMLSALAKKLHATIFGSQSCSAAPYNLFKGGSPSFTASDWPKGHPITPGDYSNAYKNKGQWTMVHPSGTSYMIKNVYFDAFGRIHYSQ